MNDEIESLYLSLGVKPDDASATEAVDKLVKTVQSKLKSSVGGKNGAITLPATIEGKFKNGKEINQDIKDAYAAIYKKAKQMADESVSLTLKDVKDFKAQIDKFGQKTSKFKGSDVIANANNNLRQLLSDYQDFVNNLRKEVSVKQKVEIKQNQKAKAQQKAKTKKSSYHGITDEEIDAAIEKENARQAKIKAWRDKQASEVASKLDYRSGSIDAGRTNKKEAMASEWSEYSSNWARDLAKTIKETYSTKLTRHIFDKDFKSDQPVGSQSRRTTKEEYLNALSTKALRELGGLIGKVEHGNEDVTFDDIVEAIGLIKTIFQENGKSMETIAKSISTATQSRYDQPQDTQPDDHGDRKKTYKKDRYGNRVGGIDAEEGEDRGVGKGHARAQDYHHSIQALLKKMLGEVEVIKTHEAEANKVAVKMTSAYDKYKENAKTSKATIETKQMANELKGERSRDERSYAQDVRESSAERMADTAEAQKNQQMINIEQEDVGTGFNTDEKAKELIDAVKEPKEKKSKKNKTEQKKDVNPEYLKNAITNPLAEGKCPCEDILKSIQKTLSAINGHTNAISKKLDSKKKTTKKTTKKEPKKAENKTESTKTTQETNPMMALDVHRDKNGKQDEFVKDIPFDSFSPKGLSKKELDAVRIGKQLADATERAIEKNKDKQVDNPKVMTTGENFNKLAPMLVDAVKTNYGNGTSKEAIGRGKKDSLGSNVEIPAWKKAEQAIEDEAQRIKEEEEARKRLADQIALETKMAKQRNAKKQRPKTPATIELTEKAGDVLGNSLQDTLKKIFSRITGETEASRIMNMSERERAKESAERQRKYGKPRGRGEAGDRGVVSDVRYSKNLWRGKDAATGPDDPLYRDIRKTDPVDGIDVDKVMAALQKAIENNMFNAQTGGGWKAAMAASLTGGLAYAFQPSMEKTRAEIDGLNQVMSNVRNEVLKILEDIQGKQAVLGEMQENGDIEFDSEGRQVSGTPEATALFNELENSKDILDSLLAEMGNMDQVIKECGGDVGKIIKKLGFVAPELRKENVILKNIGAGLDKNGKALKYQTRMGEVLNYSFQLMARHIGQMVKNWLMMMNPINLLKRAFADFASYDVKWQRTMNVIKYNLRRIIKPFMEWIAQQLVNIIGLVNALIKGIGAAFGQNWDLFDQAAANTEKMAEDFERINNVTASFDELHDIAGETNSSDPSMDLLGDIYKPQWDDLYKSIEEFGKKIGNVIQGIQKLTEGWDFWKWLAIAGAALLGLMALKWLIELFSGKNPLKSVADGFAYLEKAVGWALLIWAFTEFTKALTDFVECMKTADWPTVAKALIMLGGAFAELVASIVILEKFTKKFDTTTGQLLGLSALVWVFGEFVKAVIPFIECIKDLVKEFGLGSIGVLGEAILGLVGAFAALVGAIGGLEKFTKVFGTDFAQLFGLSALVYVFGEFVKAVIPFINCIKDLVKEFGLGSIGVIIEAILGLVGAFGALVVGVYGVEKVTSKIGMFGAELIGLSAVVGALSLFVKAITPFLEVIGNLGEDKWGSILGMITGLVGAFIALAVGVGTISRAFSTMDWKAILQLYAVAGVFEVFMAVLVPFVKAIKDVPFETLAGGAVLIAGAFLALGGALALISPVLQTLNFAKFLEFVGIMVVMAGLIWVLQEFAHALSDLTTEQIFAGLALLAGGLLAISAAVTILLAALSIAIGSGVGALAILALMGLLAVIALVVVAIADLVRALGEAGEGIQKICEGIATVLQTIGDGIVGIITAIGEALMGIITAIAEGISNIVTSLGTALSEIITAIGEVVSGIITAIGEVISGIITAIAEGISAIVNAVAEGIATIIQTVGDTIIGIINAIADGFKTCGETICQIVETIANAIKTVLEPIMEFVDSLIGKIVDLAKTIAHEIGETIRTIIQTVGDVILGIIDGITSAIPKLLDAILRFCREIGPAIENSCDAIMRTITKLINFVVSGIEYLVNTLVIDAINGAISTITLGIFPHVFDHISIARFTPQYEKGTNFVPNDQLAYLHKGEAVIPAKYNQGAAYQSQNNARLEESINQLTKQVAIIGNTVQEGIQVQGQFVQRGTDLVASVERSNNKLSNAILSNKVYAR